MAVRSMDATGGQRGKVRLLKEDPEASGDLLSILKYFRDSAEKIFGGSGCSGSNSQHRSQLKFQGKRVHLQEYRGGGMEGILGD